MGFATVTALPLALQHAVTCSSSSRGGEVRGGRGLGKGDGKKNQPKNEEDAGKHYDDGEGELGDAGGDKCIPKGSAGAAALQKRLPQSLSALGNALMAAFDDAVGSWSRVCLCVSVSVCVCLCLSLCVYVCVRVCVCVSLPCFGCSFSSWRLC